MERKNVSSGRPWEAIVGYSRVVRVGPFVYVTGTTATNAKGAVVGVGDPQAQARQALTNIDWALEQVGARRDHVVRTRIFVKHISDWEKIGRVHHEWFGDVRPATSMVEVSQMISSDMLVEIEVDAVVHDEG